MNTEEIMKLADAYAAAEQHDYLTGEASADHARAALEAALSAKQREQEPVYRLLDWIINECVVYPESDDEKKFAKRLLDAITHPKSGYPHPAPSVNAQERISELEAQNAQLLEALKKIATVNAMDYEYQRWAKAAIAAVEAKP